MPVIKSNREFEFSSEEEKNFFIAECKAIIPEHVTEINDRLFEAAVYDLLVDITRTFDSDNEETYGKVQVNYLVSEYFLSWKYHVKVVFDNKSKKIIAKSDIDDEFERTYLYCSYRKCFVCLN